MYSREKSKEIEKILAATFYDVASLKDFSDLVVIYRNFLAILNVSHSEELENRTVEILKTEVRKYYRREKLFESVGNFRKPVNMLEVFEISLKIQAMADFASK